MLINIKWSFYNSSKFYIVVSAFTLIIWYLIYQRILYLKEERRHIIYDFYDEDLYNATYNDVAEKIIKEKQETAKAILLMKKKIKIVNTGQKIYNKHVFDTHLKKLVVVIQVHSNLVYFRELIDSLHNVTGIQNSLIIFAHDYYDEAINKFIKSIIFLKYIQIFYPFSVQLHPKIFPGSDNMFCKDDFDCEPSTQRDHDTAQSKNFWWWQITHVFDYMDIMGDYNGPVVFLEEDNYVAADFQYVLKVLLNFKEIDHLPGIISLGATAPSFDVYYNSEAVLVRKSFDDDGVDILGLVFDRKLWNVIKSKASHFCHFDDYKWVNSLRHVAANISEHFNVYTIQGPRVLRFDKCDEEASCKIEYKVEEVKSFVEIIQEYLFPSSVVVLKIEQDVKLNVTPSYFFNDVRDRELCMYFINHEVWF